MIPRTGPANNRRLDDSEAAYPQPIVLIADTADTADRRDDPNLQDVDFDTVIRKHLIPAQTRIFRNWFARRVDRERFDVFRSGVFGHLRASDQPSRTAFDRARELLVRRGYLSHLGGSSYKVLRMW